MPDQPASDYASTASTPFRSRPSCGFICWNSTEVGRILDVARSLENSCIIIGRRNERSKKRLFGSTDPIFEIDEAIFTDARVPVVVWPSARMSRFDGFFEVIVCQSPLAEVETIIISRIVTIPEGGDCRGLVESAMNSISRE